MPASMSDPMTLAQVLAAHPWPAEYQGHKRVEVLWHFDLPASVSELWPLVADTSRMNRALGLSEMKFEDKGGVRHGSAINGGMLQQWIEVPWDWVVERWMTSVRVYQRGFAKVVYGIYQVEPRETGSRLTIYFGAIPRGFLGGAALRYGLGSIEKAYRRVLPEVAVKKPVARPALLLRKSAGLPDEAEARLAKIRDALYGRKLDRGIIDRLVDWVRTGDDADLFRIQIRERARVWGVDEDEALRVCLHATRAGLLELSWDSVCPHCRGPAETTATLGSLAAHADCGACGIDFGTDTLESVEITFQVHPSIRQVPRRTFCSAEPSTKQHIRAQCTVAPGAEAVIAPPLSPGRYRLRLQGEKRYGHLDVGAGTAAEVTWKSTAEPAVLTAAASPALRLVNDGSAPRTFVVEAFQWSDLALRPGRLLNFQEFRDLFSEEYLGADVQLAIGEQTILFTDIVGSTAMYATRGDPAAFSEVKRHFTEVFAIIAQHQGAVVKTIGDAAMAAFNNPLDAVKASQDIHTCFHPQRTDAPKLRISLNTGPCIAVRLNTGIDYFGHTVNVAAKLQSLAEAGQVALSQTVHRAPGVAAWLTEQGAALEELSYDSKALSEPIAAQRWSVFKGG